MRYEYARRPRKCPVCGANRIAEIYYGMPAFTEKLREDMEAGRVVLGGCCISADDPRWQCLECGTGIYKKGARRWQA